MSLANNTFTKSENLGTILNTPMDNKPTIIALCGAKGSGKDTAASLLAELLQAKGFDVNLIAIAEELKKAINEVFGVPLDYLTKQELKEKELAEIVLLSAEKIEALYERLGLEGPFVYDRDIRPFVGKTYYTGRTILQFLGFELIQNLDRDLKIKHTFSQVQSGKINIITDLRFLHEYTYVRQNSDPFFLYIQNSRAEAKAEKDSHVSEKEIKTFRNSCYCVPNNGSLAGLKRELTLVLGLKKEWHQ